MRHACQCTYNRSRAALSPATHTYIHTYTRQSACLQLPGTTMAAGPAAARAFLACRPASAFWASGARGGRCGLAWTPHTLAVSCERTSVLPRPERGVANGETLRRSPPPPPLATLRLRQVLRDCLTQLRYSNMLAAPAPAACTHRRPRLCPPMRACCSPRAFGVSAGTTPSTPGSSATRCQPRRP